MSFKSVIRAIVDSVFPPMCPLCGVIHTLVDTPCEDCAAGLTRLEADSVPLSIGKVWFKSCRACFAYDGMVKDALHRYKYGEGIHMVKFFTREIASVAQGMGMFDVVVPVPLHRRRQAGRGFNQSALVASRAAGIIEAGYEAGALARGRDVAPQVGLGPKERIENVKGAFEVVGKKVARIEGRAILLIDDVLTTGATVNECARTLMKSGAASVSVLTIARVVSA